MQADMSNMSVHDHNDRNQPIIEGNSQYRNEQNLTTVNSATSNAHCNDEEAATIVTEPFDTPKFKSGNLLRLIFSCYQFSIDGAKDCSVRNRSYQNLYGASKEERSGREVVFENGSRRYRCHVASQDYSIG